MATQVTFLFERLIPPISPTIPTIVLLGAGYVGLMFEVEKLKGIHGPLQMLRMVAVANVFRFLQSILGINGVPPSFYLLKVLPIYDLPITASIAAFYTSIRILPRSSLPLVPTLALCLLHVVLGLVSEVAATQASLSEPTPNMLVEKQKHAVNLILSIMKFFQRVEPEDTSDSEVPGRNLMYLQGNDGHLVILSIKNLTGRSELILMVLVLAGSHFLYVIQFYLRPNNVPPLHYLRKVFLFYDIPFTVTFAGFVGFVTPSDTLVLVLILELSLLAWIHKSIYKREKLNIIQGTEPEQDIRPSQASSSNPEELPSQQIHDAANNAISSPPNLSQREICDPPIGDGGSPSVHIASNGLNRDSSAANEKSAAANSISETTDFWEWVRAECIGDGGFGVIYVLHDRKTERSCAVKELRDIYDTGSMESLIREIYVLSKLKRHPNIVKYYGQKKVGRCIYLYMEYIKQGSLKQYMSKQGALDESLIRKFTAQILSGLVYLHSERVVHRDLKPDNILVDYGDIVKLVDFGLAKWLAESVGKHSQLGTPYYAAPEVLKKIEYKSSREASAADIWSLGCVIIEMSSGKHPWTGFEPVQAFYNVCFKHQHPPIPQELCSEGKDFLRLCFVRTPAKRSSAATLLEHPFVKPETF